MINIISKNLMERNFPGDPVVKTLPSNAGVQVWALPDPELSSHMPCGQKTET